MTRGHSRSIWRATVRASFFVLLVVATCCLAWFAVILVRNIPGVEFPETTLETAIALQEDQQPTDYGMQHWYELAARILDRDRVLMYNSTPGTKEPLRG